MSGRNVVPMPMPHGQMMQAPMMSSFPAGCCSPSDMSALLQCYCDVQAATAFISKVVTDLAANDPAFQQSLVDAIVASGSNIPLIGVTNGADAQPGQVGEFIFFENTLVYQVGSSTQSVSVGVLQPGDWDVQAYGWPESTVTVVQFGLSPIPVGFSDAMSVVMSDAGNQVGVVLTSYQTRALLAVPTLIAMSVTISSTAASNLILKVTARRRR